ncbi:TetR/AcrR family transcriptional regulator [Brachybacterium sp. NBEC-018]|uniref:TetR/AcrR family transcriptional regulator n=1 Tax=Brachybacterium sp. NBEC-018 TaxID=2996004 RepID=UPI0021750EEA|nr:TetR/AcrR family transcriptional regulator [Brachybacterium sp. NBEC-018]UVY85298.1 TetR/AcrR family transcriptional regulator [Brachybacterium sp. NBEC-018]
MPKIIGGSLEEHRERTREKIFAALGELLEAQDFDAVTFSAIAERAGVGRTAMYNHFPDKDTLLVAYAMHETAGYIEQLRASTAGAPSPVEAVRRYVRTQLELSLTFHMPQSSTMRTALTAENAARMREHVVLIEEVLRTIVRDGVADGSFSPALDVDATVRIVNGLVVGPTARRYSPEALEDFVLRGLGADPAA